MVWQLNTLPSASDTLCHHYIMTNQSPQLPEFNDSDLIRVNTEHHSVEIEKSEMAKVISFCRENHITQDYYMFEFMTWEHEA